MKLQLKPNLVYAVGFVVCIAPLLLGGAGGTGTVLICASTTLLACLFAWYAERPVPFPLLLASGAALVWTFLQLLPLPIGVIDWIAPLSADDARRTAALLGEPGPTLAVITRDAAGTRWEIVKLIGAIGALFAGTQLTSRENMARVVAAICASTTLMAVVGFAHLAVGAERVFGLYAPIEAEPRVLAPLLNGNHLAAFIGLGLPCLLAIGFASTKPAVRAACGAAFCINTFVLVMTASRGGAIGAAVGLGVFATLTLIRRRKLVRTNHRRYLLAGAIGFGIAVTAAIERIPNRTTASGLAKIEVALHATELLETARFTGVGRGAFAVAFARIQGGHDRYSHPESWPVQWATEWGLPIFILVTAALGYLLLRAFREASSWCGIAVIAAVSSIAVHDFIDFSLELPGVLIPVCFLFGTLARYAAARNERTSDPTPRGLLPRQATAAVFSLALIAVMTVGARLNQESTFELGGLLRKHIELRDTLSFDSTVANAMHLHPGEPSIPLLAAYEATRRGENPGPWINRAAELAPLWHSPRLLAAQWMFATGRPERGLLEAIEAERRQSNSSVDIICGFMKNGGSPEALLSRIRGQDGWEAHLDALARCLGPEHVATTSIDEALPANHGGRRMRSAIRALASGDPKRAATTLEGVSVTEDPAAGLVLADAYLRSDRPARAVEVLRRIDTAVGTREDVVTALVRAHGAAGALNEARFNADRLKGLAEGDSQKLAAAYVVIGDVERDNRNSSQALASYESAMRLVPDPATINRIAVIASEVGDRVRAAHALNVLCEQGNRPACADRDKLLNPSAVPTNAANVLTGSGNNEIDAPSFGSDRGGSSAPETLDESL